MKALFRGLVLVGCLGCGGEEGGAPASHGRALVEIVAPEEGAVYEEGEDVHFTVEAIYEDGNPASITSATWTAGSWSAQGESFTSDALPTGKLTVEVEAVVDERSVTDSVSIVVQPAGGGDEGGGEGGEGGDDSGGGLPTRYAGPFHAAVTLTYGGVTYPSGNCDGEVAFAVDDAGALEGTGQCTGDDGGDPATFALEGTVSGGTATGDLVMRGEDDAVYTVPFSGTRSEAGSVEATFDETFYEGSDSLQIAGFFAGDPVE